ncbi:branched-chain amino acid ABC transporter substrate-binding protein [Roseospira marina]|nr:branched-chain amino acid ABC transporter substrate-binding protein [Roseospira marina]MBB4314788.1 branched-chain amino acid transport system substrate-binding protein [Roseospira marina]MBB5087777.1 branched-chain amino acid transport system substrate-binding protein [Roseospira marina]
MKTPLRKSMGAALAVAVALTTVPAVAKDTVKIAFIGPLTGGVSAQGLGGRNSAVLAVALRNQDEDAAYTYDLVSLDDECKPNVGVQVATKTAADRHVIGAITHYCSAVAMGAVDIYHKFGLPVIVWGAVLPDITYGNDYAEVHRVNGTMINQNEVAAQFMLDHGYKTWAVIHDTTDYGKGHNKYFSEFLTKGGGEILGTFGVTADQRDFTAELTKIKDLDPDVIYFGGLTPLGVRIRQQMDKLGIDAQFQGTSGIVSESFVEGVGDLAEGTVAFREGAPAEKLPGGQFFLSEYETAGYDEPAEAYGPFAFAATNLLMDAIEAVGPDRKAVTEYLADIENHESITGPISFDDHGQNTVAVITKYVVQDGTWTVWEDSAYASGDRALARP